MSTSSDYSRFYASRTAKSQAEKSTFSHTCSLLRQYLKEKGTFGDLTIGMTYTVEANGSPSEISCYSATTMELFPISFTQRNPSAAVDFLSPEPVYPHYSELRTFAMTRTWNRCN